ncbi:hypothetical protein B0H19DRAFT_1246019 [Mycena capillaripes]|nr:hypothetical protein B0H19DRAFT_1246019 [Mycena capillaripes]
MPSEQAHDDSSNASPVRPIVGEDGASDAPDNMQDIIAPPSPPGYASSERSGKYHVLLMFDSSPASTQGSLIDGLSRMTADADGNAYDGAIPGRDAQSSPGSQSRKRKASTELPLGIFPKAARNLAQIGEAKLYGDSHQRNSNSRNGAPDPDRPETKSILFALDDIRPVRHGQFDEIDEMGGSDNDQSTSQISAAISESDAQIHEFEDIEEATNDHSSFEDFGHISLLGFIADAPPNHCLEEQNEEQDPTASGINTLESSSVSTIVSGVPRASSEPLHTPATQSPCTRTIEPNRRAAANPLAFASRKLAPFMVRDKRLLNRNRAERVTMTPFAPRTPRRIETGGLSFYEALNVATSVIYWPEDSNEVETVQTGSTSQPSAGVEEFEKHLPHGGTILSVHQPTTSLAWLEENCDHPVVKLIRRNSVAHSQ